MHNPRKTFHNNRVKNTVTPAIADRSEGFPSVSFFFFGGNFSFFHFFEFFIFFMFFIPPLPSSSLKHCFFPTKISISRHDSG